MPSLRAIVVLFFSYVSNINKDVDDKFVIARNNLSEEDQDYLNKCYESYKEDQRFELNKSDEANNAYIALAEHIAGRGPPIVAGGAVVVGAAFGGVAGAAVGAAAAGVAGGALAYVMGFKNVLGQALGAMKSANPIPPAVVLFERLVKLFDKFENMPDAEAVAQERDALSGELMATYEQIKGRPAMTIETIQQMLAGP